MAYTRKPQGVAYHPSRGRLMELKGYSLRIYWSPDMLDYLRRHYATTLNDELAGCLNVSMSTLHRKARQLGLKKNAEWLAKVWEERRLMAHAVNRRNGVSHAWGKGQHANPAGEYKPGHRLTPEQEARRRESMRRWHLLHPDVARASGLKAWETRRKKQAERVPETPEAGT